MDFHFHILKVNANEGRVQRNATKSHLPPGSPPPPSTHQRKAELKCVPLSVLRRERGLTFLGTTLWAGTWQDFFHFVLKDRHHSSLKYRAW